MKAEFCPNHPNRVVVAKGLCDYCYKQTRPSEKNIRRTITDMLGRLGIHYTINWQGQFSRPGVSDLTLCYEGRFVAVEVKKPGGRTTQAQEDYLESVRRSGGLAFVAYDVEDVVRELGLKARIIPLFAGGKK